MGESEIDRLFRRKIDRGQFVKLGALAAGTTFLAACGGSDSSSSSSGSIEDEPGNLSVLEWAGYEYPTYGGKGPTGVLQPYVDKYGKPKFTLRAIRSMVSSILGVSSAIISIITGLWEYLK